MLRICINCNLICWGNGWKSPKKYNVIDIARRMNMPTMVAKCTTCQLVKLKESEFLQGR